MNNFQNQDAPPNCKYDDIEEGNINFSDDSSILKNSEEIDFAQKLNPKEEQNNKPILKPREYQQKIFDRAKYQNSIIYVETGKGKTFISIMLMANYLGLDINNPSLNNLKNNKNKKIIFFVCDTALIEQQKNAISNILGIEVGKIQGKKNKKAKNDYNSFRTIWDSLNIFVAIPDIIYKLLSCGFLKIFEISMMIFDECHHASDDHPYNKIMNEFYFFYKIKKPNEKIFYPRIYGLTASPLKKGIRGSVEASICKAMENLCENLDCLIVIDPEMNNSNALMMKPKETIEQYLKDDSYIEVIPHNNIPEYKKVIAKVYNECFLKLIEIAFYYIKIQNNDYSNEEIIKKYAEYVKNKFKSHNLEEYNIITEKYMDLYNLRKKSKIFFVFEKIQRQIFMILENLCLNSLILYFESLINIYTKLYNQKIEEEKKSNNEFFKNSENRDESNYNILNISDEMNESDNDNNMNDYSNSNSKLILDLKDIFVRIHEVLKNFRYKEGNNYISDRLKKLYIKIKDIFNNNDKSKFIIFIANRIVAHFLHPELNEYLKNNFKNKQSKEIIGINKQKSESGTLTPSLTLKQMDEIIKDFNEDKFNILIGTSAIEEGLDIQSCNAVLALVELRTPKSFIQIKGRARKSNSHFIIFTNSSENAKQKIQNFLNIGQKINELFKDDIVKDFRRPTYLKDKIISEYIFNKDSHSKLSMGNITIFYNEIIQQIKSSGKIFEESISINEIRPNNQSMEIQYNGIISIKTDLNIKGKFPKILTNFKSKDLAYKMCYFYVLDVLKKFNYLDQYLKYCEN